MSKTNQTTQVTLTKSVCAGCGETVEMRTLPQSDRDYCPACGTVQEEWSEREEEVQFQ